MILVLKALVLDGLYTWYCFFWHHLTPGAIAPIDNSILWITFPEEAIQITRSSIRFQVLQDQHAHNSHPWKHPITTLYSIQQSDNNHNDLLFSHCQSSSLRNMFESTTEPRDYDPTVEFPTAIISRWPPPPRYDAPTCSMQHASCKYEGLSQSFSSTHFFPKPLPVPHCTAVFPNHFRQPRSICCKDQSNRVQTFEDWETPPSMTLIFTFISKLRRAWPLRRHHIVKGVPGPKSVMLTASKVEIFVSTIHH